MTSLQHDSRRLPRATPAAVQPSAAAVGQALGSTGRPTGPNARRRPGGVPAGPPFQVRCRRLAHDVWRIEVAGGLDLFSAPLLDAALLRAFRAMPPHVQLDVEVDLQGLTFLDSCGLDALHAAVADLDASGVQVTVGGARRQVRRLLRSAAEQDWLATGPILAAACQPDHDAPAIRPAGRPTVVRTMA